MSAQEVLVSAGTQIGIDSRNRVRGLDELRGISILFVMLCHGTVLWNWMPSEFSGYGFHGVVLFFIVSGYLITRILMDTRDTPSYFSTFYINRFFRIWPLMLVALLVSALLNSATAKYVVFNLLLVNNYAYAYGIEPMFRTDVMWSLAIEEQFYLIWPALVALLAGKRLKAAATLIVLLGLMFDAGLIPSGAGPVFKTTHGNMQYIAMGALIATGRDGVRWIVGAWAAFILIWMVSRGMYALADFRYIWHGISFMLALLVHGTVHGRLALSNRFLAHSGRLCYGLYIIHFFVSAYTLQFLGQGVFLPGAVYVGISFLFATASLRFFEIPVMRKRSLFHNPGTQRTMLIFGLTFTILCSVVGMMNLLILGSR